MQVDWFSTWFNSPYYHILYKDRNIEEAAAFINNLIDALKLPNDSKILDIACGKGRHSIFLNKSGFNVTGIDLSEFNIQEAKQYANHRLHFDVWDMREMYKASEYDLVMNLFTSFGYFDTHQENIQSLIAARRALKSNGIFVLDFLNVKKAMLNYTNAETKTIEGILFHIDKSIVNGFIIKTIRFEDHDISYFFQEKVRSIDIKLFTEYFQAAELEIIDHYGSYDLRPFDESESDRLVFLLRKK